MWILLGLSWGLCWVCHVCFFRCACIEGFVMRAVPVVLCGLCWLCHEGLVRFVIGFFLGLP